MYDLPLIHGVAWRWLSYSVNYRRPLPHRERGVDSLQLVAVDAARDGGLVPDGCRESEHQAKNRLQNDTEDDVGLSDLLNLGKLRQRLGGVHHYFCVVACEDRDADHPLGVPQRAASQAKVV